MRRLGGQVRAGVVGCRDVWVEGCHHFPLVTALGTGGSGRGPLCRPLNPLSACSPARSFARSPACPPLPACLQSESLKIFVAIVPVFFDSLFKVRRSACATCLFLACLPCLPGLRGNCTRPHNPAQQALTLPALPALVCLALPALPVMQVWIFIGLNKQDPAAAVTLKQMDRH